MKVWFTENQVPVTYQVKVAILSLLVSSGVQRTVVTRRGLPRPVQVVWHQVDEVQVPE